MNKKDNSRLCFEFNNNLIPKSKRSQGEIITTVLIILLVLAAIVIVWQVVNQTVSNGGNQVSSQSSCLGVTIDISNAPAGQKIVTVRRGSGSTDISVTGYKLFIDGVLVTTQTKNLAPLDTDAYTSAANLNAGQKIEAAAVIGNNVCPPTGSYIVK